ncbi:zinc chelation protein SecC [Sphingomonas paucimobilis]|uniref:Zinc chelation protein SecC n=1 Tax=Sphingomonas paucimobilis TaxID=13689 RepID=A0A7Y2KTY0_SPHPI|nr:zinc chelation protein SecC [Sphingomonas paucimobilis]NNG59795.1 zinc chelation protein SecC [Sphingomonas paucimobilis]
MADKARHATTPVELTDFVRRSAAKLSDQPLVYVPYEERAGARQSSCFSNVQTAVAEDGGSAVHGWMLWELPGAFIEAEHHALWLKPDGSLVDITPKADGEQVILFVEDAAAAYTGKYIDQKRFPAFGNRLARDFIKVQSEMERLVQPYRRVGTYQVPPSVEQAAMRKRARAMKLLARLERGETN